MMTFWPRFSRTSRFAGRWLLLAFLALPCAFHAHAQAPSDVLSQAEVDELRDAAFVPADRVRVFVQILDDRTRMLNDLLAKRRNHTDFGGEVHDLVSQMGAIADELNDNLDEYDKHHRDVRKELPKLLQAAQHWVTSLQAPPDNEDYAVVRRIALGNVKDTQDLAHTLQGELDAYFKAHPDAMKQEKRRTADPHAVENPEGP